MEKNPMKKQVCSEYNVYATQINIYISERKQITRTQKSKKGNEKASSSA